MAYVCDIDHVGASRRIPAAPKASFGARIAGYAQRAADWLAAWNEAADEAAIARRTYGACGGKITDGLEREMMRQLLRTE
ncbi:MAG TPA: hypothetical protein PKA55_14255 [Rhodoblastus sp.]|nr:hypothetical protein [Rhodoblastus sp.]